MSLIPVEEQFSNNDNKISDEIPSNTMTNGSGESCYSGPRHRMSIYGPDFKYGPNRRVFKQKPYLTPDSDESESEASDDDEEASGQDEKKGDGADEVNSHEETEEKLVGKEDEVKGQQQMEGENSLNKDADEWFQRTLDEFDQD